MGEENLLSSLKRKTVERKQTKKIDDLFPAAILDHTHLSDSMNSWTFYSLVATEQKRRIWGKKNKAKAKAIQGEFSLYIFCSNCKYSQENLEGSYLVLF